jgi:septal ring factor EnvC (AmiA/AmiB activator)
MDLHDQDKQIQKKIDWISSQVRETKIQLKRQYKDLEDALKEQEKLRKNKKRF